MKFDRHIFPRIVCLAVVVGLGCGLVRGAEKPKNDAARRDFLEMKAKAETGNPAAQNELGLLYERGVGVKEDRAEALKWFRKAAEQNYAMAQFNLGMCYCEASGIKKKDYPEGLKWLRLAADQNYTRAQVNLGVMYHEGEGVDKDYAEAQKWYRRAAEQNSASALSNLGVMYEQGQGVEKDYVEAAKWYRRAAELGDEQAQTSLGVMYSKGLGMEKDIIESYAYFNLAARTNPDSAKARDALERRMTIQQVSAAQKRAREIRELIDKNLHEHPATK